VRDIIIDFGSCNVIDIGSGTGFFIRLWQELGVKNIVGTDLTKMSVENLTKEFPFVSFYQLDIGDDNLISCPLLNKTYDVVSCFDVLYHIVDDHRYETAINNIYRIISPGGFLMLSDNFVHGRSVRGTHQVSRSLEEIEKIIARSGFQIIDRRPLFYLMNYPVDSSSTLRKTLWNIGVLPSMKSEIYGYLIGFILYPIELTMTRLRKESPTTELMICRKNP
jgi:SAM-dependent methyltransferase